MASPDTLTDDEAAIACSYHDNTHTRDLAMHIGDAAELERLNKHRGTNWTQAQLDRVLQAAIQMRIEREDFTIAIVATGPSVKGVDLSAIEADISIGVNGAIELFKPDIWFSLDPSPVNRFRIANPVDGVKYIVAFPDHAPTPPHVTRLTRIQAERTKPPPPGDTPEFWMWRWNAVRGLSEDPGAIHTGNSAYGALGLAYHYRPKRIMLYGVDGTPEDRATGGRPRCLDHLPVLFASAELQLREAGIEVLNLSESSRISCFEMIPGLRPAVV